MERVEQAAGMASKLIRAVQDPLGTLEELNGILGHSKVEQYKVIDEKKARRESLEFISKHYKDANGQPVDATKLYQEYLNSEFRKWYVRRFGELYQEPGFRKEFSSDFDCATLYVLTRAAQPAIMVTTGVCQGSVEAHILAAMRDNGKGSLYSNDRPHPDLRGLQGFLVPEDLRDRWELINGDSQVELPKLLDGLGRIDHFHHDSLHTPRHMRWEYQQALPHLTPGGILSSHDVVTAGFLGLRLNPVFRDFCEERGLVYGTFRNVGIAIKGVDKAAA